MLEYLYILDEGNEITFLYERYTEDDEMLKLASLKIKKNFWESLNISSTFEHRLSALTPDGIHIYKLHGYKVIDSDMSYMDKYTIEYIEIFDDNDNLLQSIEVYTLVPVRIYNDFGFVISDWNFEDI